MSRETFASDSVVLESPLSFTGSYKRIINLSDNKLVKVLLFSLVVLTVWSFIVVWYAVTLVLVGWFLIPFRLIRRGQRRDKREQLRHREVMERVGTQSAKEIEVIPPVPHLR